MARDVDYLPDAVQDECDKLRADKTSLIETLNYVLAELTHVRTLNADLLAVLKAMLQRETGSMRYSLDEITAMARAAIAKAEQS